MRWSKRLKQIIEIKRDGVKNPTSWLFITVVEDLNLAGVTENITPASGQEALPGGGGGSHVALLNFKTSCVGVYKRLIVAYCRLCHHCCNLAKEGCLVS